MIRLKMAGLFSLAALSCGPIVAESSFLRGDVDGDGRVQLTDAVRLFEHLFREGSEPGCLDAADAPRPLPRLRRRPDRRRTPLRGLPALRVNDRSSPAIGD